MRSYWSGVSRSNHPLGVTRLRLGRLNDIQTFSAAQCFVGSVWEERKLKYLFHSPLLQPLALFSLQIFDAFRWSGEVLRHHTTQLLNHPAHDLQDLEMSRGRAFLHRDLFPS